MDPNATLKVTPERLAELASVDPDATPGPSAALRQIGSVRPPPQSTRPSTRPGMPPVGDQDSRITPSHALLMRPSRRPRPQQQASAFGTFVLYALVAVMVSAAVIALIALAGRLMQ